MDCFSDTPDVYVGKVKYIDTTVIQVPYGNIYHLFIHKRIEYEYENELRAFVYLLNPSYESDKISKEPGVYVSVNLETLIEKVIVEDKTLGWHLELIKSMLSKIGLKKDVAYSSLGESTPLR